MTDKTRDYPSSRNCEKKKLAVKAVKRFKCVDPKPKSEIVKRQFKK